MTVFLISALARSDLDGIWEYTVKAWGADQAERYLRLIETEMKGLAVAQ